MEPWLLGMGIPGEEGGSPAMGGRVLGLTRGCGSGGKHAAQQPLIAHERVT
jgi:hypothetical protein